jgi:hypothetical protein
LGEIQPICQDTRMIKNSVTEIATRSAKAQAMRLSGDAAGEPSLGGRRSMNTPAPAKAANTPKMPMIKMNFMGADSPTRACKPTAP